MSPYPKSAKEILAIASLPLTSISHFTFSIWAFTSTCQTVQSGIQYLVLRCHCIFFILNKNLKIGIEKIVFQKLCRSQFYAQGVYGIKYLLLIFLLYQINAYENWTFCLMTVLLYKEVSFICSIK